MLWKNNLTPPPPSTSEQTGVNTSLLYSGSIFKGHQKSKGNCYEVEVKLKVNLQNFLIFRISVSFMFSCTLANEQSTRVFIVIAHHVFIVFTLQ